MRPSPPAVRHREASSTTAPSTSSPRRRWHGCARPTPRADFDPRRFRPNLVIDTPGEPGFIEAAWIGTHLRIGEALLRPLVPTPRCVVPTLGHGDLPPDPQIMRTVANQHRIPVLDLGRLSCVGVYLDVVEPGTVRVGDAVTRVDGL
nr:MOSC domain-containing protein [Streptomyces torulosus]